jgi:hypothetical protein
MAVTAKWYGKGLLEVFKKGLDWHNDTIKVMLCTSSYTPDQDTHDYKDDVTNEISGDGYTAGGEELTSKTSTYIGATNKIKLSAANSTWSSASFTARTAIIYIDTGVDATSLLLGYADFGADVTVANGTFVIQWSDDGIFTITAG